MRTKSFVIALAAVAAAGLVPSSAPAAVQSKRCAWWHLEKGADLVIDAYGRFGPPGQYGKGPMASCKAAKAVGDAYLKASGWHPQTLRAAGKTWRLIGKDDHNAGDDCANGKPVLGGGPYTSYKTNSYRARSRAGFLYVNLEYDWPLADQENCSG